MRRTYVFSILAVLALPLSGCSYLDRMTGQTDDTVLPGAREDAIPGKASFPDPADNVPIEQPGGGTAQAGTATAPTDTTASKCTPEDPACKPASDGTFSDPQ